MLSMNGRNRRQDAVDEGDEEVVTTVNVGSPSRQETLPWSRQMSMGFPVGHQPRSRPAMSTQRSVRELSRSVTNSVADFFGLGEHCEEDKLKWKRRSIKFAKHKLMGGPVKPEMERQGTIDSVFDSGSLSASLTASSFGGRPVATPYDPFAAPRFGRQESQHSQRSLHTHRQFSRQCSLGSSRRVARMMSQTPHIPKRRDSVLKMAFDGVKSVVRAPSQRKVLKRQQSVHSRSFTPTSISSYQEEADESKVTPASSVFFDESINDDVFFDVATPTSPWVGESNQHPLQYSAVTSHDVNPFFPPNEFLPTVTEDDAQAEEGKEPQASEPLMRPPEPEKRSPPSPLVSGTGLIQRRPTRSGWQVSQRVLPPPPEPEEPDVPEADAAAVPGQGMRRIMTAILDNAFENSNRREIGKGIVGNIFNRNYRQERIDSYIQDQLEELDDHRPYFTYWVTFVQIVVYIISIVVYGLAPLGFEETEITALVMKPSLAYERVAYFEPDNFWIGPRQADLIHLGAKYSPCMRNDQNVQKFVHSHRVAENKTACCIRNDGSGCVQASRSHCSATLSTWEKWPETGTPDRESGSVCGLDPNACNKPTSVKPHLWKDDITQWPICQEPVTKADFLHMNCEIVGRPCCTGIQGKCVITTRDYCDFKRGYFHEEAFLCSQVSCMNEICGMIPFLDPDVPDQFYRLWTSLFLHAGLLQLVISVLFQFFIMRDLEKLAGWLRIGIIYIASGIAGSLSSAIFLPYHVEAGPAGSQFGLLACLVVELIQTWYIVQRPWHSLLKLVIVLTFLFGVGLLPMVDNWAHLVGFIFGLFLSFALLPYVSFGKFDRRRKLILVVTFLLSSIGVFIGLIIMFYVKPIYSCPGCEYFNCIPFTSKFCKTMAVNISTHTELEY